MASHKGVVPVEPIRRIVKQWLLERDAEDNMNPEENSTHARRLKLTAIQQFCFLLYGDTGSKSPGVRKLFRLLDERPGYRSRMRHGKPAIEAYKMETIDFDYADRILCRLELVHLWQEDPVLRKAYEEVDLAHLDRLRPTTRVAA